LARIANRTASRTSAKVCRKIDSVVGRNALNSHCRCDSKEPDPPLYSNRPASRGIAAGPAAAQTALTWQQIKDKFEAVNPTLKAAQSSIDESRAEEITAYLRPNPDLSAGVAQLPFLPQLSPSGQTVFRPLDNLFPSLSVSYLHEREQKRELRRDAQKKTTDVTASAYSDQERTLMFTLRSAYVQVLQNKAFLENAKANLDYWDHELRIDKLRFDAGDLAQIDYNRLRLQRIPFESDLEPRR